MNTVALSMYGQGQITLPKSWRDKFDTKSFLAVIEGDKLTIEPILPKTRKTPRKIKGLEDWYEALEDVKHGRVTTFDSFEDFSEHILNNNAK